LVCQIHSDKMQAIAKLCISLTQAFANLPSSTALTVINITTVSAPHQVIVFFILFFEKLFLFFLFHFLEKLKCQLKLIFLLRTIILALTQKTALHPIPFTNWINSQTPTANRLLLTPRQYPGLPQEIYDQAQFLTSTVVTQQLLLAEPLPFHPASIPLGLYLAYGYLPNVAVAQLQHSLTSQLLSVLSLKPVAKVKRFVSNRKTSSLPFLSARILSTISSTDYAENTQIPRIE